MINSDLFNLAGLNSQYIEEKLWGWKYNLTFTTYYALDICFVKKGGYSSIHYHSHVANQIFVLAGLVEIMTYKTREEADQKKFASRKAYSSKESYERKCLIKPPIIHQFFAPEESIFVELTESMHYSNKDIKRLNEGGCKK